MKRLISVVLFYLLLFSSIPVAFAADTSAATFRLQKAEGTVSVENQNGKSVSMLDGMRLYSGYTVATEAESYAHISLDSTKALKLDASSEVQVCKSGSKLELHLVSGGLLCDVSKTLSSNESLSIRTSTTITGIRGTTVFFRQTKSGATEVSVLHGTITLTTTDPSTGENKQVTVTTGQMATVSAQSEGSQPQTEVGSFHEEDIPGYVGIELAGNEELRQRLTIQGTEQDLALTIKNAEKQLQSDHKEAERRQQELDQASKQNSPPGFDDNANSGNSNSGNSNSGNSNSGNSSSGNSNSGNSNSGNENGGNESGGGTPHNSITLLAGSTETDLRNALQNYTNITLSGCNFFDEITDNAIYLTSNIVIPTGKTLTLSKSTLHNNSEFTLNNEGTLTLSSGSLIQNYGTLINHGNMVLNNGSTLSNYGTVENSSKININSASSISNCGQVGIGYASTLINQINGEIKVKADCVLYNDGDAGLVSSPTGCTLINLGTLNINPNGALNNLGIFHCEGTLYLDGTYDDIGNQCYIMEEKHNKVAFIGNASGITADHMAESSKLILLADITLSDVLPEVSTDFTIDLNGHALTLNNAPLSVAAAGTLTIIDNSVDKTGKITGSDTLITSEGSLTISSGTIDVAAGHNGIVINSGAFEMTGGTITAGLNGGNASCGVFVTGGGSSFNLNGGTITASGGGYCVKISEGGSFTMDSGTIEVGQYDTSGNYGIDINGGNFNMNGGTITVNTGSNYGVRIGTDSTYALDGGNIIASGNNSTAVIVIENGTLAINNGLITTIGNDSNGVYLTGINVTFIIKKGYINASGEHSIGVFSADNPSMEATLSTYVSENKIRKDNVSATYYSVA